MSLFNLTHKNVVVKFCDSAAPKFDSTAFYVFRLTGVDGMGFLQIQALKAGNPSAPETDAEAYWINKDIVREIHEINLETTKVTLLYTGKAAAKSAPAPAIDPIQREIAPKLPKAKAPSKIKTALKQKPIFS